MDKVPHVVQLLPSRTSDTRQDNHQKEGTLRVIYCERPQYYLHQIPYSEYLYLNTTSTFWSSIESSTNEYTLAECMHASETKLLLVQQPQSSSLSGFSSSSIVSSSHIQTTFIKVNYLLIGLNSETALC